MASTFAVTCAVSVHPVLILLILPALVLNALIQGLESGANACFTRPTDEQELLAHIQGAVTMLLSRLVRLNPTTCQITCYG
ncbi:MAG TPA: hypothetical protein IGS53_20025 [Leptolyngbyaceae cyanobacterium M33_DOE_097]|uniref:Uncharacterized protein n=1 Tax=Oscillatoriales cyanobacterium SpSt-418 TaxID=2282169 RepID=A0A7C3PGZ1_9CYAN|nr:hypothetical protein [Leptolyngbyaceae cyanobacterium M33_DOE_097]